MLCPNCRKEIDDNAVFCPICGKKLSKEQVVENAPNQAGKSGEESPSGEKPSSKNGKSHKLLRIISILLIVSLVGIALAKYKNPYAYEKHETSNGGYYIAKVYKKDTAALKMQFSRIYYDAAGKASSDEDGWHKYEYEYNSTGTLIKTYYYDKIGDYKLCIVYNEPNTFWVRYDHEGKLKANTDGIAKTYINYNEDFPEVSFFGADGKPINCPEGWAQRKKDGDRIQFFDADGKLVVRELRVQNGYGESPQYSGWAVCEYKEDSIRLYDADMKPINCTAGWSSLIMEKKKGEPVIISFHDKKQNLVMGDIYSDSFGTGKFRVQNFSFSYYINQYGPKNHSYWCDPKSKILREEPENGCKYFKEKGETIDLSYIQDVDAEQEDTSSRSPATRFDFKGIISDNRHSRDYGKPKECVKSINGEYYWDYIHSMANAMGLNEIPEVAFQNFSSH